MIFDEVGNVVDKRVLKACDKISQMVDKLFTELFKDDMTIVEARALRSQLITSVDVISILCTLSQQTKLMKKPAKKSKKIKIASERQEWFIMKKDKSNN